MEDSEIIGLFWNRSEEAVREAARKYGGYCRSIARNILDSVQDTEECLNDTWLAAWDSIPPQLPVTAPRPMTSTPGFWSAFMATSTGMQRRNTCTGQITLQGIHITVRMGFSGTNCKSWMDIYIPVTQKFADSYPPEVIFNTEENAPFRVDTQQFSDREVIVIQDSVDDLEKAGSIKAYGVYAADGIGYLVHCLAEDWDNTEEHPTVYRRGAERLMELLEKLE